MSRENATANRKFIGEIPQSLIDNVNSLVNKIEKSSGKEVSFRDFIRHMIKTSGYDIIEDNFNKLQNAYEATGRTINEDLGQIYDSFFYEKDKLEELNVPDIIKNHMQKFNNLGFNNPNVELWHKDIINQLNNDLVNKEYWINDEIIDNKTLLEKIAFRENIYNHLNEKNLINRGFCPITGESIGSSYNYSIFGRKIYLSLLGLNKCEEINKSNWKSTTIGYDDFKNSKKVENKNIENEKNQGGWSIITIFVVVGLIISMLVKCVS